MRTRQSEFPPGRTRCTSSGASNSPTQAASAGVRPVPRTTNSTVSTVSHPRSVGGAASARRRRGTISRLRRIFSWREAASGGKGHRIRPPRVMTSGGSCSCPRVRPNGVRMPGGSRSGVVIALRATGFHDHPGFSRPFEEVQPSAGRTPEPPGRPGAMLGFRSHGRCRLVPPDSASPFVRPQPSVDRALSPHRPEAYCAGPVSAAKSTLDPDALR